MITAAERAHHIRNSIPKGGLFAGHEWRISPEPFRLEPQIVAEFETLGRVLLQFYRAANQLYFASLEGKQPSWVAQWLDMGKPASLLELQRSAAFRNDVPRVIRPDVLVTDEGLSIIELDSVPGGIGLTAWLNRTYSEFGEAPPPKGGTPNQKQRKTPLVFNHDSRLIGGADGMLQGFAGIFGEARQVHIVISDESATYRPEMEWVANELNVQRSTFNVQPSTFNGFDKGDAVYRFFELFDVGNVPNGARIFDLAREGQIRVTPPPKPILEEKMLFALLWNRNLREFWKTHLGEAFLARLLKLVPYSWVVDPTPIPPQAAFPGLDLTNWHQLKGLSQRERELILKVSGFSADAWGARGVFLGSDLSYAEWSAAVDRAIDGFGSSPYVLQRYTRPKLVEASYFDFESNELRPMPGRLRLCPYYFVIGEGDAARAWLSGVLATICPADKKIIHGMKEAILVPCTR